ncbi:MAG: CoA transferase [Polaromonas sp. 39-63-203]|uniref:CoA transferase n=1 Tax=Polaromonas sp. TaxID=1869339 RepID=UPI000BD5790B|nr:CoA transferase [Polaromonas sp.]OYY51522.1 MAG: CoA transferase [Polaromonas sp. 35-63-240]OYZ82837.1 MAG: CoA transferase [Polaromonas sp. 24-62-144]OZA96323.1 MAG: CoA transferase [Polaromonas sp. 39-63-203]HQS33659.1 CoA transferase [Polaromonas sp.]HQS92888.1 CoA transferase [Polaromonas sp.]
MQADLSAPKLPLPAKPAPALKSLKGIRILSLALNLPGPAALMRCRELGARCVKLEPPPHAPAHASGDPMSQYNPTAYAALHEGVRVRVADLKTDSGQRALQRELASADVLLTSFRPSALSRLGLGWKTLHRQYPTLSQVAIVGAPGAGAEEPGHDLTYLAKNDLITGLDLPATLYADMGGSLMATQAVLQAVMHQAAKGTGLYVEVALSDAATWLALPRAWGLTKPGAAVGGGHAGYRVYPCKDGRVAVAALEPHFAARLCTAAGMEAATTRAMFAPATQQAIADFFLTQSRLQLDRLAAAQDIPLHTLSD